MNGRIALVLHRSVAACLCVWLLPLSGLPAADQVATGVGRPAAALTLEAQCPPVFGNHAVFQQGIPVPVWGTSLPEAKVTVSFANQSMSTVAGEDGRWRVTLDPLPSDRLDSIHEAPKGRTLSLVAELDGKKARKVFVDILVGEVWLCSGQSNMAAKVRHNHANQDPKDNLLKSNFPAIRHICAPGGWQMATPRFVGEFTRVGFCFARKVHLEQKVPVGLLNACAGGSRIESWMRVPPVGLPETSRTQKIQCGALYRQRVAPLVGYGMRGALWYQGEANAAEGHSLTIGDRHGSWESFLSTLCSWPVSAVPRSIIRQWAMAGPGSVKRNAGCWVSRTRAWRWRFDMPTPIAPSESISTIPPACRLHHLQRKQKHMTSN